MGNCDRPVREHRHPRRRLRQSANLIARSADVTVTRCLPAASAIFELALEEAVADRCAVDGEKTLAVTGARVVNRFRDALLCRSRSRLNDDRHIGPRVTIESLEEVEHLG